MVYESAFKMALSSIDSAQRRILVKIIQKGLTHSLFKIYTTNCSRSVNEMFIHEDFIEVFRQMRCKSSNEFLTFNVPQLRHS